MAYKRSKFLDSKIDWGVLKINSAFCDISDRSDTEQERSYFFRTINTYVLIRVFWIELFSYPTLIEHNSTNLVRLSLAN